MPRILVYHDLPIHAELSERRPELDLVAAESPSDVHEALGQAHVVITNPTRWDDAFLEELKAGSWVQATSSGYAAFPLDAFEDIGVAFTNATGNYDAPVSEHVFALAFGISRGLPAFTIGQQNREWRRGLGATLSDWTGQTMTIVGLGSIGSTVAERARAFGMTVNGVKQSPDSYTGPLATDRIYGPETWETVLPETDLLVLTVPLTPDTRGLIDETVIAALPSSAVLINVARGPIVDETALVEALDAGELRAAGLDVFETEPLPPDSPLWDHENVIITPHVGGRSDAFVDRFADLFLENYDRWRNDEPLKNTVLP